VLHHALHDPVTSPPGPDLRTQLAVVTSQRDDALHQLNLRTNTRKLIETHDLLLHRLETAVARLQQIVRALGGD
jgi:hypothetical protein